MRTSGDSLWKILCYPQGLCHSYKPHYLVLPRISEATIGLTNTCLGTLLNTCDRVRRHCIRQTSVHIYWQRTSVQATRAIGPNNLTMPAEATDALHHTHVLWNVFQESKRNLGYKEGTFWMNKDAFMLTWAQLYVTQHYIWAEGSACIYVLVLLSLMGMLVGYGIYGQCGSCTTCQQ